MTFTVTYRDKSGKKVQEVFEAESRAELFGQLKEHHINALKVDNGNTVTRTSKTKLLSSKAKKIIAGLFIITVCGIAVLILFRSLSNKVTTDVKKTVIKAKPDPVTIVPTKLEPRQKPIITEEIEVKKDRPTKVGEVVNNYIKLPSGRIHYIKGERTNTTSSVKQDWFRVFKTRTDNELALILTLIPGETVVGTPVYRRGFKAEFLESLKEPIEILPEDSEEIRALKSAVIEARRELKVAIDKGEDVDQIVYDARNQFQDLATYRQNIESLINDEMKSVQSEEELNDLMTAAEKMMAEKGIAPESLNTLSKIKLKFMLNNNETQKGSKQ